MVPHFKLNFTRTIELEIPWLFVLEKEVELEVEMELWKYSDPPSTVPTASPSAAPVMQPTVSPSLAPTPLVMVNDRKNYILFIEKISGKCFLLLYRSE